jgi:hypothetical protein
VNGTSSFRAAMKQTPYRQMLPLSATAEAVR